MKQNSQFMLIYLFTFILLVVYGKFRCENKDFKDPLEKRFFYEFDGWSVTHFTLYMVIGYLNPEKFVIATIFGILWELFEYYVMTFKPPILNNYGLCDGISTDKENTVWWYAKWTDILCNSLGFISGAYLKNKF